MNSSKTHRRNTGKLSPISYERLAILMAISGGGIEKARVADAVLSDLVGAIVLKSSTTYYLISELLDSKYIEGSGDYFLTDKGWRTLRNELNRIERQRSILKQRLHI